VIRTPLTQPQPTLDVPDVWLHCAARLNRYNTSRLKEKYHAFNSREIREALYMHLRLFIAFCWVLMCISDIAIREYPAYAVWVWRKYYTWRWRTCARAPPLVTAVVVADEDAAPQEAVSARVQIAVTVVVQLAAPAHGGWELNYYTCNIIIWIWKLVWRAPIDTNYF